MLPPKVIHPCLLQNKSKIRSRFFEDGAQIGSEEVLGPIRRANVTDHDHVEPSAAPGDPASLLQPSSWIVLGELDVIWSYVHDRSK